MTRMGSQVRVLQKGKITIPLEIRERLAIKEGDTLTVAVRAGQLVLSPEKTVANPIEMLSGLVKNLRSRGEPKSDAKKAAAMRIEKKISRVAR